MDEVQPLENLITEASNPQLAGLDTMSIAARLEAMNAEDARVAEAVADEIPNIARAVHRVVHSFRVGGRLFYVGAGTSGRLGVLDASECAPTFGTPLSLVQGIMAGGDIALRFPVEGVEDDAEAGELVIAERDVNEKDTVVGISASGRTPYVIGALTRAKQRGATVVALVNNKPSDLERIAHITIAPIVGPEVLAGSTRLKSGTSVKLVLNMLTTCSMVEIGKTYGNLMVDVKATNRKLIDRAIRILIQVTGASEDTAERALHDADGSVKVAAVMIARTLPPEAARELLDASGGFLRKALGA